MLDIIWANLSSWVGFIPRIGSVNWLMGFAGSVGKLMQNIGLEKVMMSTLAGIDIMLLGKKFPKKI